MSNYVTPITCSNLVRLGQAVSELMELLSSQQTITAAVPELSLAKLHQGVTSHEELSGSAVTPVACHQPPLSDRCPWTLKDVGLNQGSVI